MKLKKLIQTNIWLSIEMVLLQLLPDEKEYIAEYEKMYTELCCMKPKESNITIDISHECDSFDNTSYVDVSGYYTNPADRTDKYTNSLAIEYVPWNEWLGMDIDKNSLKNFTELEIIVYCMNEMTYAGFDQDDIQEQMDNIKTIKEDYDNLSNEEKEKRTFTKEELMKKYDIDFEKDEEENNTKD